MLLNYAEMIFSESVWIKLCNVQFIRGTLHNRITEFCTSIGSLQVRRILLWIFLKKRLSKLDFVMKFRLISDFMKNVRTWTFFFF